MKKFVPELPDYGRPIIIRHLMTHTSGLRDYLTLWSLAGVKTESWTTQKQAVQLVARQKRANFSPGEEYLYSNTGYLLLAEIVERAGGSPLVDFANARIFRPLGMHHTFYLNDHTRIIPNRATGYAPRAGGGFQVEMSNFEQVGDGSVQTTVEDLLLWDRNFYAPTVGDAALLERAQTVGKLNNGRVLEYAAGLMISEYRGLRTVRHGGSWAGYRAELLRFPTQKTSIACLCNIASANPSRLANQVADVILEKSLKPVERADQPRNAPTPVTLAEKELSALAGVYRNSADERDYRRLFVKNGKAFISPGNVELIPVAVDRFEMSRSGSQLQIGPAGEDRREITVIPAPGAGTAKPIIFRLLPPVPAAGFGEYAGQYYSEELDTTYLFSVREGRLMLRLGDEENETLHAAARDVFLNDGGLLVQFDRANGNVAAARVGAGRVRDLEFRKVAATVREWEQLLSMGIKRPLLKKLPLAYARGSVITLGMQ